MALLRRSHGPFRRRTTGIEVPSPREKLAEATPRSAREEARAKGENNRGRERSRRFSQGIEQQIAGFGKHVPRALRTDSCQPIVASRAATLRDAAEQHGQNWLDTDDRGGHDWSMPSDRVAQVFELAARLGDEERAELADRLWSTVPDELSDEWNAELRDRVAEMEDADSRGEPAGVALSFDEMMRQVRASSDNE
jgi:hypothetical protein